MSRTLFPSSRDRSLFSPLRPKLSATGNRTSGAAIELALAATILLILTISIIR